MLDKYKSKLGSEFTYVNSPDHPNLISSPDALVAKKGEIIAYYRVHSDEQSRLKQLLSRLAISRLAFPVHTKHVLVLPKGNIEKKLSLYLSNFDLVIEDSDFTASLTLLNDKASNSIVERNLFLRDEHYIRFGITYQLSISQEAHVHNRKMNVSLDDNTLESVYYSDWFEKIRNKEVKKIFLNLNFFIRHQAVLLPFLTLIARVRKLTYYDLFAFLLYR